MDRLGRRGEGLKDVGYAGGRIGGESRSGKSSRGNQDKRSSAYRPASTFLHFSSLSLRSLAVSSDECQGSRVGFLVSGFGFQVSGGFRELKPEL